MRHRAAFLRTVLLGRPAMLLDEPFGALDGITRSDMQHWLLEVWEEVGSTVILITHDVAEAVYLADRVYVLSPRPGRVAADLTIELPRPRTLDLLGSQEFATQEARLREALRLHSLS
jgi:ABC-type nitrate/sulfonate/bicarbonate transport system ATPase subunit